MTISKITSVIAEALSVLPQQVHTAITLLDQGNTVPFIARYRKEATQGLDDGQLRFLEERLIYLRELEERREYILKCIQEQNKLTPELKVALLDATTKMRLEDLYLPYKPKRRTKGQIAKEAGLDPLAQALWSNPTLSPEPTAQPYVDAQKGIVDIKAALDGARAILMEQFAQNAALLTQCRSYLQTHALLHSVIIEEKEKEAEAQKFKDYFQHVEALNKIPSHRALAMLRGRREGYLRLHLALPETQNTECMMQKMVADHHGIQNRNQPADPWLSEVVRWTWRVKLQPHLETELIGLLREKAEEEAILVFKKNLYDLLMAPPAGALITLGLDPGLRTGVKVAIIDETGKVITTDTIYPHSGEYQWKLALEKLHTLIERTKVKLVSIGNGTGSRETERLMQAYAKQYPDKKLTMLITSEAGASVYSASETAAKEFPDLDVSLRGAISIARRLQDPLAELVKIEPKAIGVGQYQHDVNQIKLTRALTSVVEDAVNAVGVDLNTASVPLLACVAGLNSSIAQNIVNYRNTHGAFQNRAALKKVPRLGEKAFEQSAGFLKIIGGNNPLDTSCVHPEAYPLVERMTQSIQKDIHWLIGNEAALKSFDPKQFVDTQFGLPTIKDVIKELEKPGRDPRAHFQTARLTEGIESIADLKENMILEGTVTNVANFGAFVDIGVHQDGLIHISQLSHQFVKNPHDFIKTGQIVTVRVLEIDIKRKRISLSLRLETDTPAAPRAVRSTAAKKNNTTPRPPSQKKPPQPSAGTLGFALQAAFKKGDGGYSK